MPCLSRSTPPPSPTQLRWPLHDSHPSPHDSVQYTHAEPPRTPCSVHAAHTTGEHQRSVPHHGCRHSEWLALACRTGPASCSGRVRGAWLGGRAMPVSWVRVIANWSTSLGCGKPREDLSTVQTFIRCQTASPAYFLTHPMSEGPVDIDCSRSTEPRERERE